MTDSTDLNLGNAIKWRYLYRSKFSIFSHSYFIAGLLCGTNTRLEQIDKGS